LLPLIDAVCQSAQRVANVLGSHRLRLLRHASLPPAVRRQCDGRDADRVSPHCGTSTDEYRCLATSIPAHAGGPPGAAIVPSRVRPSEETTMSRVRVLVGTRKGAFVMTADGRRDRWTIDGPLFGGWEVLHVKGSPADPDRIYASQHTGWFGQVVQRSDDGGRTWAPVGNRFVYEGEIGNHRWYDGTPRPWQFRRVW